MLPLGRCRLFGLPPGAMLMLESYIELARPLIRGGTLEYWPNLLLGQYERADPKVQDSRVVLPHHQLQSVVTPLLGSTVGSFEIQSPRNVRNYTHV